MQDLVVGIDASTTAVKAIAFGRDGSEAAQARTSYPLSNPAPGHFEQNAEDWWTALTSALKDLCAEVEPSRIAAISIANQRETFTLVDRNSKPLIPAILWLDERGRPQVERLSASLGRENIREWSGKPPDPTPALYGLAWLAEHRPETLQHADRVLDVHGFLVRRLTGADVTSIACADPLGIVSMEHLGWHPALVEAAGLTAGQLPDLVPPGAICGSISKQVAQITGLKSGTPVVAGAGDGQAVGLGLGVIEQGKAYLSLGSGLVSGMFSEGYRHSEGHRTLTSPTGRGFMLETVLRSGMQLVDWLVRVTGASSAAYLETESRKVPPGSEGLLLMPYWSGVMSPYWDGSARGAILGLSLDHSPAHLHRAVLEGLAYEQWIATEAMEKSVGEQAGTMTAAGGGTNSRLLMDVMASVLERPLFVSPVNEAAALGAAILAATALGWFTGHAEACAAMTAAPINRVEPVEELRRAYGKRKPIYRDVYQATGRIHTRLAELG
jgi:xylulokinase